MPLCQPRGRFGVGSSSVSEAVSNPPSLLSSLHDGAPSSGVAWRPGAGCFSVFAMPSLSPSVKAAKVGCRCCTRSCSLGDANEDDDDEEEDDDDDVDMNDSTKSKTSTISSSSIVQGIESVSNRIIKILIQNRSTTKFTSQPGVKFVDSDTVHTCFRMCAVARSNRVDFQTFFDLMQQEAEDLGLMDLEDAMLDNMLPLNVLRRFLNNFLKGISRMQVGK